MSILVGNPFFLDAGAGAGGAYEIERSLRFNSSDSAFLSRTPSSTGNRKTWTWAGWVKRVRPTWDTDYLFGAYYGGSLRYEYLAFTSSDRLEWFSGLYDIAGTTTSGRKITSAVFRDTSAWYHVVAAKDTTQATAANRFKLYVNGVQISLFDTSTDPALNDESFINDSSTPHRVGGLVGSANSSQYLADVHFIDGQALDPSSFVETSATTGQLVPIAYSGTYGTNGFHLPFSDNSTAAALGTDTSGNGNDWTVNNISVTQGNGNYAGGLTTNTGGFQSSYETVKAFDGSTATSARTNSTTGNPTLTWTPSSPLTGISSFRIYNGNIGDNAFATGTITVNGGSSLTYTDLGISSFTAQWIDLSPYLSSGTFTTFTITQVNKGSYTLGLDLFAIEVDGVVLIDNFYGQNNDSLVDTPTSVSATDTGIGGEIRGNYATFNPIGTVKPVTGIIPTLTNGNLDATHSGGSWQYANSTIAVPAGSGKYYCEFYVSSSYAPDYIAVGVNPATASTFSATVHSGSQSGIFYSNNGEKWVTGSNSAYGSAYTTGDLIGVALNCDSGQITFYKNNTSQGAISFNSNLTNGGTIYFTIDIHTSNLVANFGQRPFAYTAPSGFKALCTTNLPAPVVAKPSTVMDVALYTGTGSSLTVSSLGFSPDLVWLKSRGAGRNHRLTDTVRGATKVLQSDLTSDEVTEANGLTAFNSNGFTVGSSYSISSEAWVGWCFDAGSNTVSNTAGSISSQVRANPSAGFSVVTFTFPSSGSFTVGHGLGVAPSLIIMKHRNRSGDWLVYHASVTSKDQYLVLNSTAALASAGSVWGASAPTSTVFGAATGVSGLSGDQDVAYCFAPVAGYSSFGSYVGNGSASDGPFVYTGFRPRFLLIKGSSVANTDWAIIDTARDPYNIATDYLAANSSGAEQTLNLLDVVSNGFKIKAYTDSTNQNNQTYVWAAFAENPFQYARAR